MLANYKVSVRHVPKSQLISSPPKAGLPVEHFFRLMLNLCFFHAIVTSLSQLQACAVGKLEKEMRPEWVMHWRPWSKFCAKGLSTPWLEEGWQEKLPWPQWVHRTARVGSSFAYEKLHTDRACSFQNYPACPCWHHPGLGMESPTEF